MGTVFLHGAALDWSETKPSTDEKLWVIYKSTPPAALWLMRMEGHGWPWSDF